MKKEKAKNRSGMTRLVVGMLLALAMIWFGVFVVFFGLGMVIATLLLPGALLIEVTGIDSREWPAEPFLYSVHTGLYILISFFTLYRNRVGRNWKILTSVLLAASYIAALGVFIYAENTFV